MEDKTGTLQVEFTTICGHSQCVAGQPCKVFETPRHTGMRYDVVERDTLSSYTNKPFTFQYELNSSFFLRSDARHYIEYMSRCSSSTFLLIDTVEGEIL